MRGLGETGKVEGTNKWRPCLIEVFKFTVLVNTNRISHGNTKSVVSMI